MARWIVRGFGACRWWTGIAGRSRLTRCAPPSALGRPADPPVEHDAELPIARLAVSTGRQIRMLD